MALVSTEPAGEERLRGRYRAARKLSAAPRGVDAGRGRELSRNGKRDSAEGKSSSSRQSRRPKASRGEARAAYEPACLLQEPQDLETRWWAYVSSDEYLAFEQVVQSLRTLPAVDQLAERRVEFELLLHRLHRLGRELEVEQQSKGYRAHYSPDVQLCGYLYSTLLTAFTLLPSYVLNGQEFYVSDTVLDQCQALQDVFQETCRELQRLFENLQPYSLEPIRNDVKRSLVYFDRSWCRFEMPALEEIEAIHRQACRPLIEAIEAEQALAECESKASASNRGSAGPGAHRVRVEVQRSRLMEKICELNRLANVDGKGRSDMDLTCVLEAEKIAAKPMCAHLRGDSVSCPGGEEERSAATGIPAALPHRCNGCASPVLLRVSRVLLKSLERVRKILERYARCLYQLNSHLANNADLVRSLERFEAHWETANKYLVQQGPRRLALLAHDIVCGVREQGFEAALVNLDPGFLVASLPRAFLFHEMLRFAAAKAAAVASSSSASASPAALPATAKPLRVQTAVSIGGGKADVLQLPRTLEGKRAPASAFQFSLIARSFLPPSVLDFYNETAAALESWPEARLARLRSNLICACSSGGSTPAPTCMAKSVVMGAAGAENASNERCENLLDAPDRRADAPVPRTPCPPRMAVPNSSHGTSEQRVGSGGTEKVPPAVGKVGVTERLVVVQLPPEPESDGEEEEEEVFAIDLSRLREAVEEPEANVPSPSAVKPLAGLRDEDIDAAMQKATAAISTLALQLQRTRAHEWNELLQVVLQGVMLAKSERRACSAVGKDRKTGAGVAADVW
eukprot:gnl/TRDRNA2_/TRDRNA2_194209_c0_seq1.p1 gnl/TRDRNA2_/TRDRNA2_194209_c0~~gnl/TRDRNA2_/TRDRNA2_194209_c0_seq1.p1  ORF type:complete len:799 (-),score=151.53 gnl/TRDRNA2_/TRDRNA2_194209_c0_seq1:208-2604(-)